MIKSSKITWHTEKRQVKDFRPFKGNPRSASDKEYKDLNNSLTKFDLAEPLVINLDNTVIGGNFRLKILHDKAVKTVDVRVPSRKLTAKEANELNLRLNYNQGHWDYDLLLNFDDKLLLDVGFNLPHLLNMDYDKEWQGMPEFKQDDLECFKLMLIRFKTKKDYERFAKLIKQKLTEKTKSVWYPKQNLNSTGKGLTFVNKSKS